MANTPEQSTFHWTQSDPDEPATTRIGDLGAYRTTVAGSRNATTTYLDTADWRLRAKGIVLAHEVADGAARLVVTGGGRRDVATPLTEPVWPALADDLPEGAVRDAVSAAMWIRAVAPVLTSEIRRSTVAVLNDDAKTVVRIDVVTATGRDAVTHVTIRPVLGYDEDAAAVRDILAARDGVTATTESLADALLAAAGLPASAPGATFHADTPAAVAVAATLRGFAAEITGNTAGVIADVDTEFLHDLRVAVRRTRSMLKLVGDVLPFDTARYVADFKLLGDVTTPTRDLDVYLLEIPDLAASLTVGSPDDLIPFRQHIEKTRESALRELSLALRSKRFTNLMRDWNRDLDSVTDDVGSPTVGDIAQQRIRRIYKKVVKIAKALTPESESEDVHTLRKRCKELRYLLEFFAPVCEPNNHKAAIKDLKQLQDILGDFQDGEVQSHSLRVIAEEMLTGQTPRATTNLAPTLLAMGELSARFARLQSDARAALDGQLDRYLGDKAHARIEALLP